jgi:hypothetical protein
LFKSNFFLYFFGSKKESIEKKGKKRKKGKERKTSRKKEKKGKEERLQEIPKFFLSFVTL